MVEESTRDSLPLDYSRPTPPRRAKYVETAEDKHWRWLRILFRVGLFVLFWPLSCYFGPNMIMFGKPTPLSASDLASTIDPATIATVRAMKEYQRDTGNLPNQISDIVPKYLSSTPTCVPGVNSGTFSLIDGKYNEMIEYDFTPGSEGWIASGPFVRGPLPLPPVTIGPATKPSLLTKQGH